MTDVITYLHRSASLVKTWGQSSLPDGRTLEQAFTFEGLPLWDVIAPALAVWLVPRALSRGKRPASIRQRIRPYLVWTKYTALAFAARRVDRRGCAQWPAGPTCLFLGFSPYMYRDVLEPVAARLEEQQIQCVSLYDRKQIAPARGGKVHSIWQHKTPPVAEVIRVQRRELSVWAAHLLEPHMLPRIICDGARPLWPQINDLFHTLFLAHLPYIVAQAVIARHILETHRPALIVSADESDARARLYILLGREYGIPSLEVQFSLAGSEAVNWQFLAADHIAVRSEKWREALLEHGVPAGKMTVTGTPIYDDLVVENREVVARVRKHLAIPEGHKMALFASLWIHTTVEGGWDERLNRAKQKLFEAASRVPGLTLVVKPHPVENVAATRKLARGFDNIIFVNSQDDIRDLAKACDVFISFGSSTIQSALIAGKPVIYPIFPDLFWFPETEDIFLKSDVVIKVRSIDEMVHRLNNVVDGSIAKILNELEPARRRFIKEWVHQPDGQAAARIADLAMQMAGGGGIK